MNPEKARAQNEGSRIVPLPDKVLVQRAAIETKTKGGLLIPEKAQAKQIEGIVEAAVHMFDNVPLPGCGGSKINVDVEEFDEDLLAQLQKGENINITISKGQLNTDGVEARKAVVEERKRQDNDQILMQKSDIFISQLPDNQIVIQEENINENVDYKQLVMTVKQQGQQSLLLSKTNDVQSSQISEPRGENSSNLIVPDADTDNDQLLSGIQVEAEYPEVADRETDLVASTAISAISEVTTSLQFKLCLPFFLSSSVSLWLRVSFYLLHSICSSSSG